MDRLTGNYNGTNPFITDKRISNNTNVPVPLGKRISNNPTSLAKIGNYENPSQ